MKMLYIRRNSTIIIIVGEDMIPLVSSKYCTYLFFSIHDDDSIVYF